MVKKNTKQSRLGNIADGLSVTVSIPCFNGELYIAETLDSICRQSRTVDEILVIDDGSVDESRNIARRFSQVRVISHAKNKGIAAARNSAIKHAKGEIIVFCDADVVALSTFVEEILKPFSEPGVAGVNGKAVEAVQRNMFDRWRDEVLFQHWGETNKWDVPFLFGLCSAYRKNVLEEVGGYDELFAVSGEDMDISYRIRRRGYRLAYSPSAVVQHQRKDTKETIARMTFRHCFWGFIAQKKNHCYQNKLSLGKSAILFIRLFLFEGILKGNLRFALLSLELHVIIGRAWIEASKASKYLAAGNVEQVQKNANPWEGHI